MSKDFHSILKSAGLKITPTRKAILAVFSLDCKPINAEYIFGKLKTRNINLVTIYRNLDSFERVGILKRLNLDKGSSYYELTGGHHHHHIICTNCGATEEFSARAIEQAIDKIPQSSLFSAIDSHSLELFGVCKKCMSK
jgi:Fe2+ or Zn2+ uptake regulation protein